MKTHLPLVSISVFILFEFFYNDVIDFTKVKKQLNAYSVKTKKFDEYLELVGFDFGEFRLSACLGSGFILLYVFLYLDFLVFFVTIT